MEIADAPELNSPMYATAFSSWATLRAFSDVASGSQLPACAVESSSDSYLTVVLPALLLACFIASSMPWTIAAFWSLDAPGGGRRKYTLTVFDPPLSPDEPEPP